MNKTIYLDNAATTFPKPESVYQIMDKANRNYAVNAGRGSYKQARFSAKIIDDTKNKLRQLINADTSASVIFSPSITIALNQIIFGYQWKGGEIVYVSPYEHNAVARTLNYLKKIYKITIKELPIDKQTLEIDLEKMSYEFSKNHPDAIFCTHVSNVIGYILPIKEIFEEGKKYNSFNVLDSAQSLGLIPIDSKQIKVDIIAFAGHKTLYGPLGIGGFFNITAVKLQEFIVGGTGSSSLSLDMPQNETDKFEAASKNIIAIFGLNAALKEIDIESNLRKEMELKNYLIGKIEKIQNINMFLPQDRDKQIGIISFVINGMLSDDVGLILDEDFNIAVRTGYHCAPFIHKYLKDENQNGTIRVGLGRFNTKEDIDKLIDALEEIIY